MNAQSYTQELRLTVVIAEGDLASRRALVHLIEDAGHTAVAMPDGLDIMRVIGERPVDVVLADDRMPGMSGSELLATVARLHPRVFRVLMSGSLVGSSMIDAVNHARANYLLPKPFHVEEVRELLRLAAAEHRVAARLYPAATDQTGVSMSCFEGAAPLVFTVN